MPAFTNHLWQSTLFAALAGLLTLSLRRNRAQTRHFVWLAASMKFLLPFSLLVALGAQFTWRIAPAIAHSAVVYAIEETGWPFVAPMPAATTTRFDPAPILESMWACGVLAVLSNWLVRWQRAREALQSSQLSSVPFPIRVRTSHSLIEPGVFGIFRPVLLLPEGIADRLAPDQLRGILAHELTHVRRRDNLTAFLHRLVEAIFWFHPLVWWIGARLVEERERACDEEVVRNAVAPDVYAQGIINVCKLYVESPVACVSGFTGANLRKRIEIIMANHRAQPLNYAWKIALASAGIAALALPVALGVKAQTAEKSLPTGPPPEHARYSLDLTFYTQIADANTPLNAEAIAEMVISAVREQLGFKLEMQKAPLDIMVVDGAERPTEN